MASRRPVVQYRCSSGLPLMVVLAVCLAGAAQGAGSGVQGAGSGTQGADGSEHWGRARARRASTADGWLSLISEYARRTGAGSGAGDAGGQASWFLRPVPISLPLGVDGKSTVPVPVLVLPVPVPVLERSPPSPHRDVTRTRTELGEYDVEESSQRRGLPSDAPAGTSLTREDSDRFPPPPPPPPSAIRDFHDGATGGPDFSPVVSSQRLVEQFRAQAPKNPELPPALIPDYNVDEVALNQLERVSRMVRIRRYQLPAQAAPRPFSAPVDSPDLAPTLVNPQGSEEPPVPRFERSLMLRGELTVPRADFTEPYVVWWDASSGAARVDFHGGAASSYRTVLPDGRVVGVAIRMERSGERDVRQCVQTAPRRASAAELGLPALPDLQHFSFGGFVETESGRVERWKHTVSGRSGELGGAPGEALTFRHELLVARAADNYTATPLRYKVSVDSSVLGADCDGYEHRYIEVHDQRHDPALLRIDIGEVCEETEYTERVDLVDPLREFTMPHRDPRYDALQQQYKIKYDRRYVDDTEQAVRKNLMMQNTRFVGSGNRQSATFGVQVNQFGDRLDDEVAQMLGVEEGVEGFPSEQFPHSRTELDALRGRLPREFDWRARGAVSPVQYQGKCSSCWAFAVAGAVEGALFVRTRTLVPLSQQALVDCAQPYGARGCGGTWPSSAYDYVRDRGLAALDEYTPYQHKVLKCNEELVPPVTHISAHVNVTHHNVHALKVAIRRHSPSVVLVDASAKSFIFYKKGVLYDDRCGKTLRKLKHAVLAVGWGEHRKESHFIVKNSWSDKWGEGGYIRLQGPANTCGVLTMPSYPRLELKDVDRLSAAAAAAAGAGSSDRIV